MSVDDLVATRRLEELPADPAGARGRLEAAQRHLRSAARVAEDDPDAAYALLYDAARKAVTVAHDLEHARAIVAAVEASWPGPGAGA